MRIRLSVPLLAALLLSFSGMASAGSGEKVKTLRPMPDKADECFRDVNLKFLKGTTRLFVPQTRVSFVTRAKYKARHGGSMAKGGPSVEMAVILNGMSDEDFQAIADKVEAEYVNRLQEAGFEVVPADQFTAAKGYQKLTEKPKTTGVEEKFGFWDGKSYGATHHKTFTAAGRPSFGDLGGTMAGGELTNLAKLAGDLKATAAYIDYVVDFTTFTVEKETDYKRWTDYSRPGGPVDVSETIKTIELEAVPGLHLAQTSGFADIGFVTPKYQPAGLQQNGSWTEASQFLVSAEKNEDEDLVLTVDPVAFQEAVVRLASRNIALGVQLIQAGAKK